MAATRVNSIQLFTDALRAAEKYLLSNQTIQTITNKTVHPEHGYLLNAVNWRHPTDKPRSEICCEFRIYGPNGPDESNFPQNIAILIYNVKQKSIRVDTL